MNKDFHRVGSTLGILNVKNSQVTRHQGSGRWGSTRYGRDLPRHQHEENIEESDEGAETQRSPDPNDLCGWGPFKPAVLQALNTPEWMLFFLCIASFLQGLIVNGFINTVVTTIERRFGLPSYLVGLIASSYDIAACFCLAFVSYFGGIGHKPRWLGWGVFIMGIGSMVFSMPHFTAPPYTISMQEQSKLCPANQNSTCQFPDGKGLTIFSYMFMLGQFLHGMGATPLYTLGVTYLDENVSATQSSVYVAIFYTASMLGPATGYLLGGFFLNIYTEIHETTNMTPENPHWVGAWWIGFLFASFVCLLVAFPILGYPRQLPGSKNLLAMRHSETHQIKDGSHAKASDPKFGKSLKDMPRSVMLLMKNIPFLFLCLAGATESLLITGMSTFGPKFLESQLSLSASEAATWFGYIVVPAGGGGTFLGGYIVKKLNLRCRGIIRFCIMCTLTSLLVSIFFMLFCPNLPMAGVTTLYQSNLVIKDSWADSSSLKTRLTANCNANCKCLTTLYSPVCGADGIMYYSPCHAGCSSNHTKATSSKPVFNDCRCVTWNVSSDLKGLAETGKCSSTCNYLFYFLILFFSVTFFTFLCNIPALIATLRCVPDSQKSFGLGIQWILVRALGCIPGPIAYGWLMDQSCLLWEQQCDGQGSCYIYHNFSISRYTLVVAVIYKAIGSIFFFLASILYHPPPLPPPVEAEVHSDEETDLEDKGESRFQKMLKSLSFDRPMRGPHFFRAVSEGNKLEKEISDEHNQHRRHTTGFS